MVHAGAAGRHAQARARRSARASSASRRSTSSWSTCTRSPRRSTPARTSTNASSRSTSAARRWCAPRPRTTRASRWSSTRSATTACSPRCAPAGSRSTSGRSWRRWPFGTPPSTTSRWRPGWGRRWRPRQPPHGLARMVRRAPGAARRCCGTAKTRISRRRCTPTMRVAGPRAGRAAARKRDVVQQLHRRRRRLAGRVRPRGDLRGDHQAREPVRHRDLVGLGRRRAPQGPRMRSGERVRRSDRREHRRSASRWPKPSADIFTEVIIAPAYEAGAVDVLAAQEEHSCAGRVRAAAGRRRVQQVSGGLLLQQRDAHRRADGDDPANWQLVAGAPADPDTLADLKFAWRSCRAVKSNAIVIAARRRHRRRRHGSGEPRRRGAAGGRARRATGCAARSRPPTRSSRSPTGSQTLADGRRDGDRASRRLDARRRRDRGRGNGRRDALRHRRTAFRALSVIGAAQRMNITRRVRLHDTLVAARPACADSSRSVEW